MPQWKIKTSKVVQPFRISSQSHKSGSQAAKSHRCPGCAVGVSDERVSLNPARVDSHDEKSDQMSEDGQTG